MLLAQCNTWATKGFRQGRMRKERPHLPSFDSPCSVDQKEVKCGCFFSQTRCVPCIRGLLLSHHSHSATKGPHPRRIRRKRPHLSSNDSPCTVERKKVKCGRLFAKLHAYRAFEACCCPITAIQRPRVLDHGECAENARISL